MLTVEGRLAKCTFMTIPQTQYIETVFLYNINDLNRVVEHLRFKVVFYGQLKFFSVVVTMTGTEPTQVRCEFCTFFTFYTPQRVHRDYDKPLEGLGIRDVENSSE